MNKNFKDADEFFGSTVEEYKKWLITNTRDTGKAKETCNAILQSLNEKCYKDIKESYYFWHERTAISTVEDTVRKVEQHFGFVTS